VGPDIIDLSILPLELDLWDFLDLGADLAGGTDALREMMMRDEMMGEGTYSSGP
jgi:hypothetical protein